MKNDASEISIFPLTLIRAGGLPFQRLLDLGRDWTHFFAEKIRLETALIEARSEIETALTALLHDLPESDDRTAVYNLRKRWHAGKTPNFEPFREADFFKKLKIENFESAAATLKNHLQLFENQWFKTLAENYAQLQNLSAEPNFQRGLVFASHDLLARLPAFRAADPTQNFSKKDRQTALAVFQFTARAAAKTSPFSRFTTLDIARVRALQTRTGRLRGAASASVVPNLALLEALYLRLLECPDFFKNLEVKLNPFVVGVAPEYRFLYFDGERESFQKIEATPLLDFVVQTLVERGRSLDFSKILNELSHAVEAEPEALENFLLELTELGLLEWNWPEKGFSPAWTANLEAFLTDLPPAPPIREAIIFLKKLRSTADFLLDTEPEAAQKAVLEASRAVRDFFGDAAPPIPPEQLFYEDAAASLALKMTSRELVFLLEKICPAAAVWLSDTLTNTLAEPPDSEKFEAFELADFFKTWQEFRQKGISPSRPQSPVLFEKNEQSGALVQFFRDEHGRLSGVVNAVFPGGGKLMGRWLHLFKPAATKSLKKWNDESASGQKDFKALTINAFAWHNANLHPLLSAHELDWPGARTRENGLLAGQLRAVRTGEFFELRLNDSRIKVRLLDLGLESWTTRTPVARMLLDLGAQKLSLADAQARKDAWLEQQPGVWRRPRQQHEGWVFAREALHFSPEIWSAWLPAAGESEFDFFLKINAAREAFRLPRHVFFRFLETPEKPQYLDFGSPVGVLFFLKNLRQQKDKSLEISEMLPAPGQFVADERVSEFVFEFR